MFLPPRSSGLKTKDDVRHAIEQRFEELRRQKTATTAKTAAALSFTAIRHEARLHLTNDVVSDMEAMFQEIQNCESVEFSCLNIGTLKALCYVMQQSDEEPNFEVVNEIVNKVETYVDRTDAFLVDRSIALPNKKSKWEWSVPLLIFDQMIAKLVKRQRGQSQDCEDIKNLFKRAYQQTKTNDEDDEPSPKRRRSVSL
jgi:hypothetical protein